MQVDTTLVDEVAKTLATLEDRRLWSGAIPAVHQVVWGPPGKTWTARKDQEAWKLTGPDQAATQQPAAHDLRIIVAATHMAVELERMADLAAGIASITLRMLDQPLLSRCLTCRLWQLWSKR